MKSLIASILVLGLVGTVVGVAVQGADITATVTPGVVSVTVDPGTVSYGSMTMNDTKASGTIVATAGTADVDLTITGTDAEYTEGGGEAGLCPTVGSLDECTWTLSSAISAADDYVHGYTTDTGELTGTAIGGDYTTGWKDLTTSGQNLSLDLAGGATQDFQLDMRTPASAGAETAMGKVYSTVVTVTAAYAY